MQKEERSAAEAALCVRAQASLRMRGLLRKSARSADYSIFFDASVRLPDGLYRLLQEWIWSGRTPIVILARGASARELGRTHRLFWHKGMRLELGPLEPIAAQELFAHSVRQAGIPPPAAIELVNLIRQ